MFDAPVDVWYVWFGLALVAAAAVGAASEFPTAPPPDAAAAASTVDRVAAVDHDATARHPIDADAVKLEPDRIALRDDGRVTHERFAYGPVTPVRRRTALWRVLRGARPDEQFDAPTNFATAARSARNRTTRWRSADRLLVRTVTWGDAHVTLVGA